MATLTAWNILQIKVLMFENLELVQLHRSQYSCLLPNRLVQVLLPGVWSVVSTDYHTHFG